jgi:hypothetical protein
MGIRRVKTVNIDEGTSARRGPTSRGGGAVRNQSDEVHKGAEVFLRKGAKDPNKRVPEPRGDARSNEAGANARRPR